MQQTSLDYHRILYYVIDYLPKSIHHIAANEEERARRERLVLRANSFKKTIMDVLEFTEKTVDRHNREAR